MACCHSFYFLFTLIEQTYNAYTTRGVPSCCPHGFRSVEGLLWGASRDSNSGLPYSKPTRYCLSHAAPTIFTVLRLYSTVYTSYVQACPATQVYEKEKLCGNRVCTQTDLVALAGGCTPAARLYGGRPPPTLCGRGAGRSGSPSSGSPASRPLARLRQARFSTEIPKIYLQ